MDESGYPTEKELTKIREWDPLDADGLIDYVESLWRYADWGFIRRGDRLTLHTGGWSGNEDIIGALESTLFWQLSWEKSTRGGHYWFKIYRVIKWR